MNAADSFMDHLRRSDPCPEQPIEIPGLFERITRSESVAATPGAPPRVTPLRVALIGLAAVLVLCAVAAASDLAESRSAWSLFRSDPLGADVKNPLYRQSVVASSVRLADTARIPGYGRLELWSGSTRQHGWCAAIRLRGGEWYAPDLAGCRPTYEQLNNAGPGAFAVAPLEVLEADVRGNDGRHWRVWYGRVDQYRNVPGERVVDTVSGSATLVDHHGLFLLAVADPTPASIDVRLVITDAHGRVLTDPVVVKS